MIHVSGNRIAILNYLVSQYMAYFCKQQSAYGNTDLFNNALVSFTCAYSVFPKYHSVQREKHESSNPKLPSSADINPCGHIPHCLPTCVILHPSVKWVHSTTRSEKQMIYSSFHNGKWWYKMQNSKKFDPWSSVNLFCLLWSSSCISGRRLKCIAAARPVAIKYFHFPVATKVIISYQVFMLSPGNN